MIWFFLTLRDGSEEYTEIEAFPCFEEALQRAADTLTAFALRRPGAHVAIGEWERATGLRPLGRLCLNDAGKVVWLPEGGFN